MRWLQLAAVAVFLGTAAVSEAADVSIKGVHLCCGACVTDANDALADVEGLSDIGIDRNTKSISFKSADDKAAFAAIKALATAGFHGTAKSGDKELEFPASGAKKDVKSNSITLTGVHLCCGACVTGVQKALADVKGATEVKVDREARTVIISGTDIVVTEAVAALNKGGFHGTVKAEKAE